MPTDVNRFVERRDNCDHFRNEEPYDAARRQFLIRKLTQFCKGTDRQLATLKRKYASNPPVLTALETYDLQIESNTR